MEEQVTHLSRMDTLFFKLKLEKISFNKKMCITSAIHYDGLTCKYESYKQNCLQETRLEMRKQNTLFLKKTLLIILA